MQHSHFTRLALILTGMSVLLLAGCQLSTSASTTANGTPTATTTGTPGAVTPPPGGGTGSLPWASLLIDDSTQGGPLLIENLNPTSGRRVQVASLPAIFQSHIESISPDGQLVAYAQTDAGGATSLFVANIGGLTQPQQVAQSTGTFSNAVWQHDNSHIAVVSGRQVLLFSKSGQATSSISVPPTTSLLSFTPDDQALLLVTAGDVQGLAPGALYRVPLADATHPVQISPRENGSHFVLSNDGQTVYYDNTASSGAAGIYSVSAQTGGTPKLVVPGAQNYPLGFNSGGNLLYVAAQTTNPALKKLDPSGASETLVAKLVTDPSQVRFPIQEIALAPDATGIAVVSPLTAAGSQIFYTDLTAATPQPKVVLTLGGAPRVDLGGWDTSLVAAGS